LTEPKTGTNNQDSHPSPENNVGTGDRVDELLLAFDADTALMNHEKSFAFFVRIPYLWFDQNLSQPPINSVEGIILSEYQSGMVNSNPSNMETAIKVYHAWFVILNNRRFSSNLYHINCLILLTF
jgi:hypothetical protein